MSDYPNTPELDKLSEAKEDSQKIGEFIDWLEYEPNLGPRSGTGSRTVFSLPVWPKSRAVKLKHASVRLCRWDADLEEYFPLEHSIEEVLARYCDIDLDKIENERQAIIEHIRKQNNYC